MGWHEKRVSRSTLVAFGLALLFGFMLFKSRRFVEYYPPFALIFLALSAAPLLANWRAAWRERQAVPAAGLTSPLFCRLSSCSCSPTPCIGTLRDARDLIDNSKPADRYAAAALWLRANSEPGSKIFQTDWDDFTRLYFYNSDAIYTAGLDPTFMELQDKPLFDEWLAITRGKVENPSDADPRPI